MRQVIQVHMPEGWELPNGCEPVGVVNPELDALLLNGMIKLRKKWSPGPRLQGTGLWLAMDKSDCWYLYTHEPEFDVARGEFVSLHGGGVITAAIKDKLTQLGTALGMTEMPPHEHLPPEKRKWKL